MKFNLKNTYFENLSKSFYAQQKPSVVKNPEFVIFNEKLARNLGFSEREINEISINNSNWKEILSGNEILEDSIPIAQAYAGHQFGYFNILGDGRAILLGEKIDIYGNLVDIQLKGSGKTPYSRRGDGKATLRAMLREYIISEAMFYLKVPTTRSLAVVKSGEKIRRESLENGAILTRIASSHIRVGTFEYISNLGDFKSLKKLADYTINRHFPHILKNFSNSNKKYLELVKSVIDLQAKLIAKWKLLGFIHGVMNTDNMSISGETIDYGPCAFMDIYKKDKVFSSIDYYGRYSYENQEKIGLWNLLIFAEALYPIFEFTYKDNIEKNINSEEAKILLEKELLKFNDLYKINWILGMRKKLGLISDDIENKEILDKDENFFKELLELMEKYSADYTNTFVALTENNFNLNDKFNSSLYSSEEFKNWKIKWLDKISKQNINENLRKKLMQENNPIIIPRNHIVEEVLMLAELGNYTELKKFLNILDKPYDYNLEIEDKYKYPIISDIPYKTYCGT